MLSTWWACLPRIDALISHWSNNWAIIANDTGEPKGDTYIYCTSLFGTCWQTLVKFFVSHVYRPRAQLQELAKKELDHYFPSADLTRVQWHFYPRAGYQCVFPLEICGSTKSPKGNFPPSLLILTFFFIDYSWSSSWTYSFQVKGWRSRSYGCIDDTDSSSSMLCIRDFINWITTRLHWLLYHRLAWYVIYIILYSAYHCRKYSKIQK